MIKCCIFDLDGTILNTITSITYFVNKTLKKYGIDPITEDECKYFAGNGARKLIIRSLASKGITDEAVIETVLADYNAAYDADPLYLTDAFDGIRELLASLAERKIRLAVLSNKPDSTVKSIVKSFFPGVFDEVRGGVEGVPLKPAPDIPLDILKGFGISPENTAWIGDTSTDVETGVNLGAALNIGVLWGFRKRDELEAAGAHVIVSSPDEILREVVRFD